MELITIILFEASRPGSILIILLVIHSLLFWLWRRNLRCLIPAAVWLIVSLTFTLVYFVASEVGHGDDYIAHHVYNGIWEAEEARANILQVWRSFKLPIYLPWLRTWLTGLITVLLFAWTYDRWPKLT
jgi:hypothetical protein